MMNDSDKSEIIKILIENWESINKISSSVWNKIKKLFDKGDKTFGFIKRKIIFLDYIELSQKTFIKKYSEYIFPTEYRGYLLESISISEIYKNGSVAEGDRKRIELHKISPKALRIYNLYNTGILTVVFSRIDQLLNEGKNKKEIIGETSKLFDDLINDKSIIYVNLFDDEDVIYSKIKQQLKLARYCLIHVLEIIVRKLNTFLIRLLMMKN